MEQGSKKVMLKKKIDYGREFVAKHLAIFQCPKCKKGFTEISGNTMICQNNHRFDLSKKGTIHFPDHHMTSDYDKEMLVSRRKMIQKELYFPIMEEISLLLEEETKEDYIVDMGCGEGSFIDRLMADFNDQANYLGFDLSKEGVQLGSDFSEKAFFFIGDVTDMPFRNESISTLLNIFSPSHYEEMLRVLKPGGQLIKVIPEAFYLTEMREVFYHDNPEKQSYSNENVYEKFKKDVNLVSEKHLTYKYPVLSEDYEDVLKMSPINWGASEKAKAYAKAHPFKELTIDVKILVGKK